MASPCRVLNFFPLRQVVILWATVRLSVMPFQHQQMARLQPQLPAYPLQDMTADGTPPLVITEFANRRTVDVCPPRQFALLHAARA
jgi:hypothetical protein